jgi:hypothetical protein
MSATVIDALVVTLGLDPSQFTKGQREALDAFKKTQDQAVKGGKAVEEQSRKSLDALGGIRRTALELFAVFAGGKGVMEFAASLIKGDAAVGRLSRSTNLSAQEISKWQGAARIYGSSAEGMAQSFTTLSDAVAGFKVGSVSPLIADFRSLSTAGGTMIDVNKGIDQTLLDMAANFKALHDKDPANAGFMGRRMGLDPGLLDLLMKGPVEVKKILDAVNNLGPATKASADAAGDLEKQWNKVLLATESLGRALPGKSFLTKFLGDWSEILEGWSKGQLLKGSLAQRIFADERQGGRPYVPGGPTSSPSADATSTAPGATTATPTGAFVSQAEKEQFIRSEAAKRKINPNVAMAVAKTEGFDTFNSSIPGEKSYGAFQLNISKDPSRPSLGDRFKKDTGLDPSDRANEKRSIQYALDEAKRDGWSQWYGARNNNIDRWQGIPRNETGAAMAATIRAGENSAALAGNNTTTTVAINGPITVNAQPGDNGAKLAKDFSDAVRRQSFTAQANGGQQ